MAAQDAELKLKVSLDLGFFRQQLAGLGQAAAGYNIPVQVKFDRRSVQNELNALGANIRKRNYTLNVNTNLAAEIDNAKKLAEALGNLSKARSAAQAGIRQQMGMGALLPGPKSGGISSKEVGRLYRAAVKAGFLELDKEVARNKETMIAALDSVGRDAIAGLLNGLNSQDVKLRDAAASLGEALISTLKSVLGIASPSKETAKLGKFAAEGFGKGFASGMVQVERQMATAIRSAVMGALKEGLGRLPGLGSSLVSFERQLAAGVQASVRKAMREGLSASVVPSIKGGAVGALGGAATGAAIGGSKALTGATAAGLAKLGTGGMIGVAGQMGRLAIGDTSGLTTFIQEAVSQTINAALSSGGQGALLGAAAVGGTAGLVSFAGGTINSLTSQVATAVGNRVLAALLTATSGEVKGIVQVAVRDITNAVFGQILRQVRTSMAGLPAINWQSTVPSPGAPAIGPSSTGRLLPGAAAAQQLPGTKFGAAGFLPGRPSQASILEFNNILAGAIREYFKAVAKEIVKPAKVSIATQPLLGAGSKVAGLLPPAGGTTPIGQMRFNAVRTGAVLGQQQFMRAPSIPPPAGGGGGGAVPPSGGGGGAGGFGNFGRAIGGINLPGSGAIKELGQEFGYATKQVLLFGQAYKALAFIQNFPSQVGAAVGQLQSFRNTLNAISPTAEEAAASNRLILDLVDKYNVPLQSARDGFTKLYASMAPAGFGGEEIRKIFTGISQAAATFGLSADKVDRVNYAFAQMASKGQVMSEELKGQLGDVLPGAMAIFAEAAGFTGPKAIQEFSAALEAGQYKGEAMVALLKNVGVVLNDEFGPGAEGAARTFQGVINRLQNSIVLLYESFEPVAVGFLNAVVVPLTDGIRQISDGFNAFFTGTTAQTSGGGVFAQQLNELKPALEGIRQNITDLLPLFNTLSQVALSLGQVFIQIAGNPFTGFLLRTYLAVLPLVTAIKLLNLQAIIPLIASFVRAIPAFVAFNAAKLQLIGTSKSLQLTMQLTGATATKTATQIRTVGLALSTLVVPAVLLGIGALIERFMMLKGAVDGVRQSTQQMVSSISSMANSGAVKDLKNIGADTQKQIRTFESLRPFVSGGALGPQQKLTQGKAKQLEELGLGSFVGKDIFGKPYIKDFVNASNIIEERLKGLRKQSAAVQEKLPLAERIAADLAEQAQSAQTVTPIPGGEGAGRGAAAAAAPSLESYENLQDQIAKARTEGELERAKLLFEYQVSLDRRRFELQESAANEVQKAGIKLAKELFEIETDFRRQALESRQAIVKQEGSVAPGNLPPRAPKGRAAYGPITQFGAGANANLRIGQQVGGADMQPRPVSGSERRDIVAAEKTQQTLLTERLRLEKEVQALAQKYAQTISTNFDVIFPVAQLKLQNELLAARYQLELQAVPKEAIDAQLAIAEAEAKAAEQREVLSQKLAEETAIVEKYLPLQEEGVKLTTDQSEAFINAQAFIAGYGSKLDEIAEKTRGFTEAQLENAIANIKQADSLKALEEISGRINSAVEGVTGTFKGLVKEIVTGTDAVDALKKAQEALADQALTMFLDFAFKPVEDFFKNALGQIFGVPNEEAKRKETLAKLEAQLAEQKKIAAATQQTAINTSPTGGAPALPSGQTQSAPATIGNIMLPAGESVSSNPYADAALSFGGETGPSATAINAGLFQGVTSGLGGTSITNQAQEFSKSLENVDSSLESVTASVQKTADETSESGKAGSDFKESLGKITQGIGIAASSILGIYAGISQIKEGGTGNVLSGIGSVLLSVAGGLGGIAGLFPQSGKAAKGAVWKGGFSAFADGGMVKGPTLGLIGEGMYNEAIVPLPDGRSIPVQLNGGRSARDVMGNGPTGGSQGLSIDMKFETTKINGVEYVSREQLEAAMAETRKKAARDGATQGSQLALSKIKNSPSTRRQLGM